MEEDEEEAIMEEEAKEMKNLKLNAIFCHKLGHYSWECQNKEEDEEVHLVEYKEDEVGESLLFALRED